MNYFWDVIVSEVKDSKFNAEEVYSQFADAFDYADAIDTILVDDFCLDDYCALSLESGTVFIEGVWTENTDDHLTRWIAWVLFRKFGFGDTLSFHNETQWSDGCLSSCHYEVNRNGTVKTKVFYSEQEYD